MALSHPLLVRQSEIYDFTKKQNKTKKQLPWPCPNIICNICPFERSKYPKYPKLGMLLIQVNGLVFRIFGQYLSIMLHLENNWTASDPFIAGQT